MNFKKIFFLPAGFLLTNFAYIACCHCKPINKHYVEATNLTINPSGSQNTIVDNGVTVNMDSLYIDGNFSSNCVAVNQNPFSSFVNMANACKCQGCGDEGLKYALNSIEITSNNIFNGIPAGIPLNNYFKSYEKKYSGYGSGLSIDSIKTLINKNIHAVGSIALFTKTKPGNNLNHQLTVKATFANGSSFSSKTKDINWQ